MADREQACVRTEQFLCGVVEGFYGRPWTNQQRRELFHRMGQLGMNVYMYAPKDDLKHRAQWRDKYTPEEADCLQSVISSCRSANVNFVYALSPGIDIEYSNPKEIKALKHKFDQVRSLGCSAFALLFDDIEHHMCDADRKKFGTFASAQVAVTNDVYEYLDCPLFLFCPTEYCESRAVPTLGGSQYLETIGRKLLPKIHIFWTGPRVISRLLTANHCARVSRVLRRPALIWDNLHANDYDQRRVYLGPYAGRHINAKQYMAGVMTNPNCEFEANFVAVATLAHWANCDEDTEIGADSVVSVDDARLEAGDEQAVASRLAQMAEPVNTYHPLGSLRKAINFWAKTLQENVSASLPFSSLASFAATQTTSSAAPMMQFPNPSQTTVISSIQGPLPAYTPVDIVQSICEPGVDPPLIERRNTVTDTPPSSVNAAGNDAAMETVLESLADASSPLAGESAAASSSSPTATADQAPVVDPLPAGVNFETQMSTGQTYNSLTDTFTQTPVNIVEPVPENAAAEATAESLERQSSGGGGAQASDSGSGLAGGGGNVLSSITPISATFVQATSLPPMSGVASGQTADAAQVGKSIEAAVCGEPMDDDANLANNSGANAGAGGTTGGQPQQQTQPPQPPPPQSTTLIRPSCLHPARSSDSLTMLVDDAQPPPDDNDASSATEQQQAQRSAGDSTEQQQNGAAPQNSNSTEQPSAANEHQYRQQRAVQPFGRSSLSPDLLSLLIDLFYLPFEHGARAKLFIGEFAWLKYNAHLLGAALAAGQPSDERTQTTSEWHRRAQSFHKMCTDVDQLYMDVVSLCTSSFLVDFYPYIYEIQQIVAMLDAFVMWLGTGCLNAAAAVDAVPNGVPPAPQQQQQQQQASTLQRSESTESVDSKEVEPWVYRGGLISDLHRLLLSEKTAADLFMMRPPYAPLCRVLRVRPATGDDKHAIFNMCDRIFSQSFPAAQYESCPDFLCDFFISSYLCTSMQYSFVIEECCRSSADPHLPTDSVKVVGCALASLSAVGFVDACRKSYVPEFLNRYGRLREQQAGGNDELTMHASPLQLVALVEQGGWPADAPANNSNSHSNREDSSSANDHHQQQQPQALSCMQMFMHDEYRESPAPKMLLACVIAALAANGSGSVYVDCLPEQRAQLELLSRFGFQQANADASGGQSDGDSPSPGANQQQQQQQQGEPVLRMTRSLV